MENEIANLKKALEGDDLDAIKKATESLTQASHKLAEIMYAQATRRRRRRWRFPAGGGEQGASGGGSPAAKTMTTWSMPISKK